MEQIALTNVFWILILFLVTWLIVSSFYSWHRLRHVPGPLVGKFSYLWVLFSVASGRLVWAYQEMTTKYGHLVRVGPNLLLTDDYDLLRRMSAARSPYGKDGDYKATIRHPDHDHMLSTTDVALHDDIKYRLAGPYGGKEALELEPAVDEIIGHLIHYLRVHSSTNDKENLQVPLDLNKVVSYFSSDMVTRLSFGRELGCLESNSDVHGLISAMSEALKACTISLSIPWLRDITTSKSFFKFFGPSTTDKHGLGVMMRLAYDAVNLRYQPGAPDEKDLLGAFIKSGLEVGPCISEVLIAMIAGNDTTAATIRMTMLCVMTSPRVYAKLKAIIYEAVQNGSASNPVRLEEAKKIPYLQAVIYESIRMRPPVPIMLGKVVPPEGDMFNDKFIPGGTVIVGNVLPMQRDKRFWGPDAYIFRPERWLETEGRARLPLERIVDMAFGYGRLKCAGQPVAYMELYKVLFELFRHFDFQVVDPVKPVRPRFYTIWRDENFLVQLHESGAM